MDVWCQRFLTWRPLGAIAVVALPAFLLFDLGKVAEAMQVYERAQALKPGYPELESALALLRKAALPKRR